MAKKEDKSDLKDILKSAVSTAALTYLKSYTENLAQRIQDYLFRIEKKMMHVFFASFTLMLGIIAVFISIPFLMSQYLGLTIGWSLLIVGLVLIIIAFIVKSVVKKEKIAF